VTHPRLRTRLTELTGVRHPTVQTGMGWVSGPGLTAATAAAGVLGIIASATLRAVVLSTLVLTALVSLSTAVA
jgi:NAD(P)H-dependent flavin oxidoreductase YrpB (nitropropane dioxygenase family)